MTPRRANAGSRRWNVSSAGPRRRSSPLTGAPPSPRRCGPSSPRSGRRAVRCRMRRRFVRRRPGPRFRAAPVPAAGVQPHRHGAAHQSRPCPPAALGRRGGGRRDGPGQQPRIRSRHRRTGRARRPCRGPDLPPDRGRGGGRRQQQRRRGPAGAERPRHAQGGGGLARRVGGDRRLVPGPRRDGPRRLPAARGRHHQPHASARLRRGARAAHRPRHEGASEQLRDHRLHRRGGSDRAPRALPGARRAPGGGSGQRQPGRPFRLRPAARAHRAGGLGGRRMW